MDADSRAVSGGHRMKIGDRCFVHGYIDEIRKDTVIVRNDGGYFGTIPSEVITGEFIQCRNCKFASGDSRICMKFGHSPIGELDFCAWAERRTDE